MALDPHTLRHALHRPATPALVSGEAGGERLVGRVGAGEHPGLARVAATSHDDVPAEGEHGHDGEDDDEDDQERGHARNPYRTTLREARCAPTFRFTRWSAFSTVLVWPPVRSPTSS